MSNQKKRNFQIEAFKHRVVVDPKYADKTWQILERAIHQIYNQDAGGLSFGELYRNAYNMVLHKFGEKLYNGYITNMTAHLKEKSKLIEAAQGGSFLEELNKKWNEHNKALEMIRDILMYMDRTYIESTKKTLQLCSISEEEVLDNPHVEKLFHLLRSRRQDRLYMMDVFTWSCLSGQSILDTNNMLYLCSFGYAKP